MVPFLLQPVTQKFHVKPGGKDGCKFCEDRPGGIGLAIYADRAGRGRKKKPLLLCCGGACVGAVIFSLGCAGVVPDGSRLGVLYLGAVLASLAFNAAVPLFYELAEAVRKRRNR